MKIIKKGKIPKTTKRFTCSNCGCVFECEEGGCVFECEEGEYSLYFSQRDGDWLETDCPTCGTRVVRDRYLKGENDD